MTWQSQRRVPAEGADRPSRLGRYQVTWSVGWTLGAREQAAIGKVATTAWEAAINGKGQVRERRADGAREPVPHPGA